MADQSADELLAAALDRTRAEHTAMSIATFRAPRPLAKGHVLSRVHGAVLDFDDPQWPVVLRDPAGFVLLASVPRRHRREDVVRHVLLRREPRVAKARVGGLL